MPTKTSQQLRAELTNTFYGIDPETMLVETVTVSRGGVLSRSRNGKSAIDYRIRGGKPALGEVLRVFGLTDVVAVSPQFIPTSTQPHHPLVVALQRRAVRQRRVRDGNPEVTRHV